MSSVTRQIVVVALLLIAVTASGYVLLKHFNANIKQDDLTGLLGKQPVNLHPQAENILVIGSDSRVPEEPRTVTYPGV